MQIRTDLRLILESLNREQLPHMVVGALAVDAWGVPRTTMDIDIQVALPGPPDKLRSVYLGLVVEEWSRDKTFDQDVVIGSVGSPIPVEIFVTTHWFTSQALSRRVELPSALVGRAVPVPTREDLILLKAAYQAAPWRSRRKAAQDGVDIEHLLTFAPSLDLDYLQINGQRLGVWEFISETLKESRPTS